MAGNGKRSAKSGCIPAEDVGISGALASVDETGNPKSFCMGVQDAEQPSVSDTCAGRDRQPGLDSQISKGACGSATLSWY